MQIQPTDLIMLPGWSLRASVFSMLEPHLADYRLHFIDLPSLHDPQALTELAQSLPPRAAIAGWSLGGLAAIAICAAFPEKFSHLILLGSTPKFVAEHNWPGIYKKTVQRFSLQARADISKTITDFHTLACVPAHSIRSYLQQHAYRDHSDLLSQLDFLFQSDLRSTFSALTLPILSIAGDRDAVLSASSRSEIMTGAGHAFPFTHAEQVCFRIKKFLGQQP